MTDNGIEIYIDRLYRYDRHLEPCFVGFPLPKGLLYDTEGIRLSDNNRYLPLQSRITSLYDDGSVRFIFLRFLTDIPSDSRLTLKFDMAYSEEKTQDMADIAFNPVKITSLSDGYEIRTTGDNDGLTYSFMVKNNSDRILESVSAGTVTYEGSRFTGPLLTKEGEDVPYSIRTDRWEIAESGPVCVTLKTSGRHISPEGRDEYSFEVRLTAYAGKPWLEVSYRIINTSDEPLRPKSLTFNIQRSNLSSADTKPDHIISSDKVRTCVASSNYKTDYLVSDKGEHLTRLIDSEGLLKEANEHFAEVFYGTFFTDHTDDKGGICATVFQAHQNFPKAVSADSEGIALMLIPECDDKVVLKSGMAREQRFLLHFHDAGESLEALNDRSIVYQMPYRPYVSPSVHEASGVWPDIFTDNTDPMVEQNLIARADGHCRAYGMLNFGDSYDANYTAQGRGKGKLVWCNNEYDYPHSCALMYVRTGFRRFLDYNIASCSHWMDVDVCHYHRDPLYIGGQWEHTAEHVTDGVMVCSHEWVEGLLDYYHFTGDERGLSTAIGIGHNVQRLLDTPMYQKPGEINARETGWALRTLTALYVETLDESWLQKCRKILDDFKIWEDMYGHWLAPYTDNTLVRVGFMISVAIGSLMRYYRHFPDNELKSMMLRAVDDMIENCYVKEWGLFYYKELPSLNRLGNNTLLLEALAIAHDLSGDKRYLEYGIGTFKKAINDSPGYTSLKKKAEDAVLVGNQSSKNFAQSMIPIASFYRALIKAGYEQISL